MENYLFIFVYLFILRLVLHLSDLGNFMMQPVKVSPLFWASLYGIQSRVTDKRCWLCRCGFVAVIECLDFAVDLHCDVCSK